MLSASGSPASLTPETDAIDFMATDHQVFEMKNIDPCPIKVLYTGSQSKNTTYSRALFEVKIVQPTASNASRRWRVIKTRIKHDLPLASAMPECRLTESTMNSAP